MPWFHRHDFLRIVLPLRAAVAGPKMASAAIMSS